MSLNSNSPYVSYADLASFPAVGQVDTFYLDRSTVITSEEAIPIDGNLYIWNGSAYEFYCDLADSNFVGPRPAHPPHAY